MRTHGLSRTKVHRAWRGMMNRCTNPNATRYNRYGGRGISICRRWIRFENFLSDMGMPPTPKHSLERLDNDSGYSPNNCVWATSTQQVANRSNTLFVTLRGSRRTLSSLAKEFGIHRQLLWERIFVNKIPVERAVSSRDLRRRA
jgi:hypothetical protein